MKISHISIYMGDPGLGFDIILRVRGGVMKHGSYPRLEAALIAALNIQGRKTGQPIYVYDGSFAELMADRLAPFFVRGAA